MGLAVAVALPVSLVWTPSEAGGAYFAVGLALVFGMLLLFGRPEILSREMLARSVLDSILISVLIAGTGGAESAFFLLYPLAALGIAWIWSRVKVAVASAVMAGSYLAAVAAGPGTLGSPAILLRAGFIALFCAAVGLLGSRMHALVERNRLLSSDLAAERDRAERVEGVVSGLGSVLRVSSVEGILRWTAEAAHGACGVSYAHVAALSGDRHQTILEGDFDACPSWWHPSIQRLLLWSCRDRDTVRSEETVHGVEGFIAVPIGSAEGEKWGAVILGGKSFGAEDERILKLIAGAAAPALEDVGDAPGGRDQVSGLPNRASLYRVLRRELSQGRALTVLAAGIDRSRRHDQAIGLAAGDSLLRRVGERLEESQQRAFRYGEDELVVVLSGTGGARARRAALAVRKLVSEETGGSGRFSGAAVGFAFAEAGERDPEHVLNAALRALEDARVRGDGIAGFLVGAEAPAIPDDTPVAETVQALVEAVEFRDPYTRGHLEAVSELARRIGRRVSLSSEEMSALVVGALLHDLGKIGIPDRILQKPGPLTLEEYEVIKQHPMLGARMLASVRELASALPVVRHHHERFDGRGYPDGLRGRNIPLIARVVSVADAFDAMLRERPYGHALSRAAALQEVESNSGSQFDPEIVRAFLEALGESGGRRADSTG
jgi:diguanylate cyclase (GGDEF)-like protein